MMKDISEVEVIENFDGKGKLEKLYLPFFSFEKKYMLSLWFETNDVYVIILENDRIKLKCLIIDIWINIYILFKFDNLPII